MRAEPRVDSGRRAEMALITGSRRVRAKQRKAVVMLLDRRYCHIPAPNRMALLAVGSKLTPVQVGMAFRAAGRGVGEDQADVTTLARDVLVQSLKGEASLPVMIKLRLPPDRFPRSRCMAIFAGNLQIAVRIRRPAAN